MDKLTLLKVTRLVARIIILGYIGFAILTVASNVGYRTILVTYLEPFCAVGIILAPVLTYFWVSISISEIEREDTNEAKE